MKHSLQLNLLYYLIVYKWTNKAIQIRTENKNKNNYNAKVR